MTKIKKETKIKTKDLVIISNTELVPDFEYNNPPKIFTH